jgi:trimeric autotransporter adhesin
MSTKTTFKRIALVAVAALGLGVLSVAPSSAAVIGLTVTAVDGTATTAKSDSSTAATLQVRFLTQDVAGPDQDTITVVFAQNSIPATAAMTNVKVVALDTATATSVTDVTGLTVGATDSASATTAVTVSGGTANTYAAAKLGVFIDGTPGIKAGTYSLTAIVTPYNRGVVGTPVTQTINIVVAAAAADSKVASAANSTAFLSLGNTSASTSQSVDSSVAVVSTASSADIAEIMVRLLNANGNTSKVVESVTATITGPGTIGLDGGTTYGKSIVLAYNADASLTLGIRADGTAGVATITVSTPSVTFAPKSVTFYAKAPKTLTAAVEVPVLAVGTNDDAVSVTAVDANGSNWAGAAYIYASSAADALIAGTATPVACSWSSADLVHYCPVTGVAIGTAKLKVIDASTVALATVTSNEVTVTVSAGSPASIKLSFDKASYAPFEKATITVTPLDAAGKALPVQTSKALLATGGITSTFAFSAGSDTLTATTFSTSALTGVKTYTVYMPAASGDITITATGGAALAPAGQVKVTATAAIVNSSVDAATDAANEATDAANAATDAALAAADAADAATAAAQDASDAVAALSASVSKLISSLRAQITSLTNLVIKIQKKVRA